METQSQNARSLPPQKQCWRLSSGLHMHLHAHTQILCRGKYKVHAWVALALSPWPFAHRGYCHMHTPFSHTTLMTLDLLTVRKACGLFSLSEGEISRASTGFLLERSQRYLLKVSRFLNDMSILLRLDMLRFSNRGNLPVHAVLGG